MNPLPKSVVAERRLAPRPDRASAVMTDAPQQAAGERISPTTQLLQYAGPLTVLMTAALCYVMSAPDIIVAVLAMLGLASAGFVLRAQQLGSRQQALFDETIARDRAEIELLSDRMWELRESQEHFRGLIDALGDLVVHRNRAGQIVFANKVFADLIGVEQSQLPGKTLTQLGVDFGVVPDAAFAQGEFLSSTDVEIQTKDGPRWYSWIELSARDVELKTASHRAIARDITDRKRAETALIDARQRAEHASQAKSRFLATVSHEIRTPMNGIAGMAKLLADTRLLPEQQTYVSAISTSAGALIALIEDLLDFAKIEAGRLEANVQPMSPRELADSVVELLASRAYDKGIGLGSHVAPDVPRLMDSDPGKLRQVMLNLIGNAIKFTAKGGVHVAVTRVVIDERAMLQVAVTDSGNGISEADRERIFEEFEQADGTSTRGHGGVGLGLAISRRLVGSMGGSIRVDSQPSHGSVFTFVVPILNPVEADSGERIDLNGRRFLVLSNNAPETTAIAATIKAHGGATTQIENAEAAADLMQDSDAVLVDVAHGEAASEVFKRLKQSGLSPRRSIIMIAPEDRVHLPLFRRQGFETFLARPIRSETLVRALNSSLLQAMEPSAAKAAKRGPKRQAASPKALSVLLAEDNEINALLARSALSKAGHKVRVATDGLAAVNAISEGDARYDIVLMDLHMPVMDGLDAIAAIRRDEAARDRKRLPILVLSADGQDATRRATLAAGADGFIAKPLDPDALVRAVLQHAGKQSSPALSA
jgi:PAS domain S-box-containing protein